jgi:hypothetical protein
MARVSDETVGRGTGGTWESRKQKGSIRSIGEHKEHRGA